MSKYEDPLGHIEKLEQQLETEQIRLAACGVVALANTPESAAMAREMLPKYRSASCDDVAKAVDREIELRKQLADALAACKLKDAIFEKIACLGNGDCHGNSIGNDLGKDGLAIQPDDSALKAWIGEPVGYKHETSDGLSCLNTLPPSGQIGWITTPLYAPKGLK